MSATKWPCGAVLRSGPQLLMVTKEYFQSDLEKRVEQTLIDSMTADLASLAGFETSAIYLNTNKKAATENQKLMLERCWSRVSKFRLAVRRCIQNKAVRKDFGIGEKLNQSSILSVRVAAEILVKAAKAHPEAARTAGMLPDDLSELESLAGSLRAADVTQDEKTVTSRNAIAERNATQLRIEAGMMKLDAIAKIVFENRPEVLAKFQNAMPASRRSKTSRTKTEPETPVQDPPAQNEPEPKKPGTT